MELYITGSALRRALVVVVHDSRQPRGTPSRGFRQEPVASRENARRSSCGIMSRVPAFAFIAAFVGCRQKAPYVELLRAHDRAMESLR